MKAPNSGENNGRVKLTATQVMEIRRAYAEEGIGQSQLARRYGVSQSQIGRIVTGQHWSEV